MLITAVIPAGFAIVYIIRVKLAQRRAAAAAAKADALEKGDAEDGHREASRTQGRPDSR
jgi:hypothetical protein